MSSPGAQAELNEMLQLNPSLTTLFPGGLQQLTQEGMALVAVNPNPSAAGFASNVNVLVKPDPDYSDSDLNELASGLPAELARVGAESTGSRVVTFDGHRALRATDVLALNTPGGAKVSVGQTQYYVSANGFFYVVTLSGADPELATIANTFSTA